MIKTHDSEFNISILRWASIRQVHIYIYIEREREREGGVREKKGRRGMNAVMVIGSENGIGEPILYSDRDCLHSTLF